MMRSGSRTMHCLIQISLSKESVLTKTFIQKNFMTEGLLTSRKTKSNFHKRAVYDPTIANITRYKTLKTIYQRTIRGA
jgi:hypothetical protein